MAHEYDDPHFGEVSAFLTLVDAGSFARAGRILARDPSVLSRRVTALERRLGVRLIERTTRRIAVTETGQLYAERMRAALGAMAEAEAEAAQSAAVPAGLLRIALPSTFGRMWISPLLPRFMAAYPAIRIEAAYSDRLVDLVAEGYDAAIRVGDLADSRLVARKIADSRRLICAAPDYLDRRGSPAAPADLADHACLGFTGLSTFPTWRFRQGRQIADVRISGPLQSNETVSLIDAAVAGHGVVMASQWLVGQQIADGRLVEIMLEWTLKGESAVYLLRPSARFTSAKVRAFADWATKLFAPPPWMHVGSTRRSLGSG